MKKKSLIGWIPKVILFFAVFYIAAISCLDINKICAASGLKIQIGSKTINYKEAQIIYRFNSKDVDMDSTPGIIINNIAFASYTDLFKNGLGAACT